MASELQVLAVGADADSLTAVREGLARASLRARVASFDRLTSVTLGHVPWDIVFIGDGAARAGFADVARHLRQNLPQTALIALPERGPVEGDWDDQVLPEERSAAVFARVLRSACAMALANERLARWALRDPLTDVLNRRGLERVLERELSARDRGRGPLSALLLDCDDFKEVNDQHGLTEGDRVLARVAVVLVSAVRAGDDVARVGGDEFLVLLPQTRTWEAVEVAERIRGRVVSEVTLPGGQPLSVSIGVRRLGHDVRTVADVMRATQEGLRVSKSTGKNRVHVARSPREVDDTTHPFSLTSLPPTGPAAAILDEVRELRTGIPRIVEVWEDGEGDEGLVDAMKRAAGASWDLRCLERAAERAGLQTALPVKLRIYPSTLVEIEPERILEVLERKVELERVVLALDEQFLSGDPGALVPNLRVLRGRGVQLCIEISDFGRSALESLVILRPLLVRLDEQLVRGVAHSRARRSALGRYSKVCASLGVTPLAAGIEEDADRLALLELEVPLGLGAATST